MNKQLVFSFCFLASFNCLAFTPPTLSGPWSAQAELGGVANSGNTDSTSINGKFTLGYEKNKWANKAQFESQYSAKEGDRTEESYQISDEAKYSYSEKMFVYGNGDVIKQHFKPFNLVITESIGIGRRLISDEKVRLDIQAGPGGRHSRENGDNKSLTSEFIFETGLDFNWKLSPTATFSETISSKSGETNTFAKSESAIKMKFIDQLQMKLAYTAEYNSTLPDDDKTKRHYDTKTSITLVYDF